MQQSFGYAKARRRDVSGWYAFLHALGFSEMASKTAYVRYDIDNHNGRASYNFSLGGRKLSEDQAERFLSRHPALRGYPIF